MKDVVQGRRERKKASTRKLIADTALPLFLERGFDAVSVREIADAADVSTTTLFNYFPVKEALVFDEDASREAGLLAAVQERPAGTSIPESLCAYFVSSEYLRNREMDAFYELIESTPSLRSYSATMWTRYEAVLSTAIAAEIGAADDTAATALARFALDAPHLVRGRRDIAESLKVIFALIEKGWEFSQQ